MSTLTLKVISLYLSKVHGEVSEPVSELRLLPGYGIIGDSHMEERNMDSSGKLIPNRHFTAVHPAELGRAANALGVPFIDPAWLKANICFACPQLEHFTETLVLGTKLIDAQGLAVFEIKGPTDPCVTGGEYIISHFPHLSIEAQRFPKAAYNLRGVHGIALEEVTVRLYDTFAVQFPEH